MEWNAIVRDSGGRVQTLDLRRCVTGPAYIGRRPWEDAVVLDNRQLDLRMPTILGLVGICFALFGLVAWIEYGAFATRAIHADSHAIER